MTDKEKYTAFMQRYWEADLSPEEEMDLTRYVSEDDSPEFDELRGVMGFLSIGREKAVRRRSNVRAFSIAAAAACLAAVVAVGLNVRTAGIKSGDELCVRYQYGERNDDKAQIMSSVESSLADFFGESHLEVNNPEHTTRQ